MGIQVRLGMATYHRLRIKTGIIMKKWASNRRLQINTLVH
jgi:hypothetical protein